MAVDYDLVIIGPTLAAQTAAIAAAQTYARVAWVTATPPVETDPLVLLREGTLSRARLLGLTMSQSQGWTEWLEVLKTALDRHPSSVAQSHGVHYLEGPIQFQGEPGVSITVKGQTLRSRNYLLAMEPQLALPSISGLTHSRTWTISELWHRLQENCNNWPKHLTILGDGPQAVELSQSLQRLGIAVLLLTGDHLLLPQEDPEMSRLLQTYLEGSGIAIATRDILHETLALGSGQLLLQLKEHQYETEAIIIATEATDSLPSDLAPLNLRQTKQGLWVNAALQTSSANIYACGSILGGYRIPGIASCEARVAVCNALFEQRSPIQYCQLPYLILSDPPLARVGLTERQAQRYDPQVQVIRQTYQDCDRALLEGSPAGLCKVLVQSDGIILGAHIIGSGAPEFIHLFALAMQQQCSLQALGTLGYGSPTFMQIVQQAAQQWQQQQWQRQRDHHERWFYKRRQQTL